jgi:pimeloyl-ACP methyl ester carboxylesterase
VAVELTTPTPEQTRARYPDDSGYVERDGVRVYYEVYGSGEPTVLLLPTWSLMHSRHWKMQIPYLARHCRVVTFDGRGNGRSDRPKEPEAYDERQFAADALAVLDETETDRAVIVGFSLGGQRGLILAAEHPERIDGAVFIGPSFMGGGEPLPERTVYDFDSEYDTFEGWAKHNRFHWLRDYRDWVEFFVSKIFTEPHSTKPIEDGVGWGLETDGETMIATQEAHGLTPEETRQLCGRVRCPVLVIQGENDAITSYTRGAAMAEQTGGELVLLEGSGHAPHVRDPVKVNLLLRDFIVPPKPTARWIRGKSRRKRALYISSPIGLGHAQRDAAIAAELRKLHPHIEIDCAEHDLHCFQAIRRMDEILLANFMVFHDLVRDEDYDLWIGDEAWELDYYLHENPEQKRAAYVWLTDFVGWLPMADGGDREAFVTADYNAEMIEHIARFPRLRDRAVFVGNEDDIVSDAFGPDLPLIRDWTQEHYDFAGYVTGFDPTELGDRGELGYGDDERVCIVTVGGSGVGGHLLRRVIDAYPEAKERVPDLRMIVVAGPRIDPESLPQHDGLEVRAYVHDLYRHLAVCDLAVVQGGLTTSMELTANRRPFLYFPLRHHFEQNFHVRHRLARYGAGRCMDFETDGPTEIAAAIAEEIGREVDYRAVETDGAERAAKLIAELL